MTRAFLSLGSNLGDRQRFLADAVEALGGWVQAVSPVYETDAWGGVDQGPFLNAVVIADDPDLDGHGWLRLAQQLERDNERIREVRWGPRTLDVDLVCCQDGAREVRCDDEDLTLPHPLAHLRAFVLVPWLAVDPNAELTRPDGPSPVRRLLADLDAGERSAVRPTDLVLARTAEREP